MMNGYHREYDSLSSVNGAKTLCDGDYILERLCCVFFILPPLLTAFAQFSVYTASPSCAMCRVFKSVLLPISGESAQFCCLLDHKVLYLTSHAFVYFHSITPVKSQPPIKPEQILWRCCVQVLGLPHHRSCTRGQTTGSFRPREGVLMD